MSRREDLEKIGEGIAKALSAGLPQKSVGITAYRFVQCDRTVRGFYPARGGLMSAHPEFGDRQVFGIPEIQQGGYSVL
jgi:hypothetical protein